MLAVTKTRRCRRLRKRRRREREMAIVVDARVDGQVEVPSSLRLSVWSL